jgi:hypothetical protein
VGVIRTVGRGPLVAPVCGPTQQLVEERSNPGGCYPDRRKGAVCCSGMWTNAAVGRGAQHEYRRRPRDTAEANMNRYRGAAGSWTCMRVRMGQVFM